MSRKEYLDDTSDAPARQAYCRRTKTFAKHQQEGTPSFVVVAIFLKNIGKSSQEEEESCNCKPFCAKANSFITCKQQSKNHSNLSLLQTNKQEDT